MGKEEEESREQEHDDERFDQLNDEAEVSLRESRTFMVGEAAKEDLDTSLIESNPYQRPTDLKVDSYSRLI